MILTSMLLARDKNLTINTQSGVYFLNIFNFEFRRGKFGQQIWNFKKIFLGGFLFLHTFFPHLLNQEKLKNEILSVRKVFASSLSRWYVINFLEKIVLHNNHSFLKHKNFKFGSEKLGWLNEACTKCYIGGGISFDFQKRII